MNATSRDNRQQLGDHHRSFGLPCLGQRFGKLRATIQSVASFARLNLNELGKQL
jgi:hypothetical protein